MRPKPPIGWTPVELGTIAEVRFSNIDKKTRANESPVRLCNYMDVWKNPYIHAQMPFMVATAGENAIEAFRLQVDDVLLTKDSETRDEIAQPSVVRSIDGEPKIVLGYHLALVRPKPGRVHGPFLAAQLTLPEFRRPLTKLASGTTRFGLGLDAIQGTIVWLPPFEEQCRIAEVLMAVDFNSATSRALIHQVRRLQEALLQDLLKNRAQESQCEFETVRLGDIFEERKEVGKPGLPVMSVTIDDGMVERSSLDRRIESDLTAEEHLLVKAGDIAYNTMRMWQGCSGLAIKECIVSPAYIVCKPLGRILPEFGAHLLRLPETVRKLHRYSQGIHEDRLRLYFEHFAAIKVQLPPIERQRECVKLLHAVDVRVRTAWRHLAGLAQAKEALSQALLTGRAPAGGGVR